MENTDQLVPDHTVFWSARNLTHKKTSISPQCTWLTFADHCCWPFLSLSPAESAVHVIRQLLQLQYLRTNVLCLRWFVGCSCIPSFLWPEAALIQQCEKKVCLYFEQICPIQVPWGYWLFRENLFSLASKLPWEKKRHHFLFWMTGNGCHKRCESALL